MPRLKPAKRVLLTALHKLEPERAHDLTLWSLRQGWARGLTRGFAGKHTFRNLESEVFDMRFANPVGLAAGFDKNAEAIEPLLSLGFGFVEAGTLTPKPQPGNPKPRLFRNPDEQSITNRMGFNNHGADQAERNLRSIEKKSGVVGINLGANTDAADKIADYVEGVARFSPLADYLTLNVSCPNIPEAHELQDIAFLRQLLSRINEQRNSKTPLLLKLAPGLSSSQKQAIAEMALGGEVDGLVISNTMPQEKNDLERREQGGLSGRPLFAPSTRLLSRMYLLTEGRVPLVGVGGIFSAEDAYAKIRAGASLVQIYTALIYEGVEVVARIQEGLAALLARDGYKSIAEAVGQDSVVEDAAREREPEVAVA